MGSSRRRQILGKRVLINLNYAGGIRHSPGSNWRAQAVKKCAKNQGLEARKACFSASYSKPAGAKSKKTSKK